mmetsp:Transcript_17898/g.33775  ORF Transcript_17898/g.33775 Transcript_17898/m.33775 type:complete len:377 (+) Transcript_17898:153-1283(+)
MWRQAFRSCAASKGAVVGAAAVTTVSLVTSAGLADQDAVVQCDTAALTHRQQQANLDKSKLIVKESTAWLQGNTGDSSHGGAMHPRNMTGYFHKLFPMRQLWKPAVEYPMWQDNWDGKQQQQQQQQQQEQSSAAMMRHYILIPHGEDDNPDKEDDDEDDDDEDDNDDDESNSKVEPHLTLVGKEQAQQTGIRLQALLQSRNNVTLYVSDLARAKETAERIARYLPRLAHTVVPDARLNEGRPCHTTRDGRVFPVQIQKVDEHHLRIEQAFRAYFARVGAGTATKTNNKNKNNNENDTIEIIVAHPNVLRYFVCRALQLPPETFDRYHLGPCSITYLAIPSNTGKVSCRTLGDVAHLTTIKSQTSSAGGKDDQEYLW